MHRILTGPRFVEEAIRAGTVTQVHLLASAKHPKLVDDAEAAGIEVLERERKELDELAKGVKHQGVVAVGPPYRYRALNDLIEERACLVALDEVSDPHNLGATIRSAVAFGATGIIVPEHRAAHVTPTVVRASAGATEHARIAKVTNLQKTLIDLAQAGLEIVGLDGTSTKRVTELDAAPTAGRVIVIGSEGKGLRRLVRKRCDVLVSIPMVGPVESLNASVAAALAIYEATKKRYP